MSSNLNQTNEINAEVKVEPYAEVDNQDNAESSLDVNTEVNGGKYQHFKVKKL